jgi:hypothetical protein
LNSIPIYVFIFFRALSLCLLGAAIVAGVVHTIKHIRKFHDIDAISYLIIVFFAVAMILSWTVKLS